MGTVFPIKRKKFEKLESMACWPFVRDLFTSGARVVSLVDLIQKDFNEMSDIKSESLRVALQDWKRENIGLFVRGDVPETLQKLAEQVRGIPVKPTETFQILLAIEIDRLMDSYKKEKELGHSLQETDGMIKVCMEIAREQSLHEARTMKAKRGNYLSNKSDAARMDLQNEQMRQEYGETFAMVTSNPDSRRKVLSIFDNVMNKVKMNTTQNPAITFTSKPTISKIM